jgi:hypothetical protein
MATPTTIRRTPPTFLEEVFHLEGRTIGLRVDDAAVAWERRGIRIIEVYERELDITVRGEIVLALMMYSANRAYLIRHDPDTEPVDLIVMHSLLKSAARTSAGRDRIRNIIELYECARAWGIR